MPKASHLHVRTSQYRSNLSGFHGETSAPSWQAARGNSGARDEQFSPPATKSSPRTRWSRSTTSLRGGAASSAESRGPKCSTSDCRHFRSSLFGGQLAYGSGQQHSQILFVVPTLTKDAVLTPKSQLRSRTSKKQADVCRSGQRLLASRGAMSGPVATAPDAAEGAAAAAAAPPLGAEELALLAGGAAARPSSAEVAAEAKSTPRTAFPMSANKGAGDRT
mmetsp:Transcript_51753/g.168203  ORF Transcript_51753/g.168203 Transcript_51753/m.168203 type:complete len:220 (+) Transcript_51753:243-902(+)